MAAAAAGGPAAGAKEGRLLVDSFLHLMISQVSSRMLTFLLNLLVARRLTPGEYGVSAIQFSLLTTTILFISREGFRRGCLRSNVSTSVESQAQLVSIAWLTVPLGFAMSATTTTVVVAWRALKGLAPFDSYSLAIYLHGLAAIIEICSEPLYIKAQSLVLLRLRVMTEAAATLARCCMTCFLLVARIGRGGGLVFAYAEVAYSSCLLLGYWGYFATRPRGSKDNSLAVSQLLPSRKGYLAGKHSGLLRLCGIFTLQSIQKLALQSGDALVLVLFDTAYNQGVYALVSNLGSLVVRMVLQPLEESAFLMFAKATVANNQSQSDRLAMERLLLLALKVVIYIGFLFVVFGPNYSYVLLRLLYGTKWSDGEAPRALACYCLYVMVLAANGITEAFLHAVVTEEQLARSNRWLVGFTLIYTGLSVLLIKTLGSSGLILANCFSILSFTRLEWPSTILTNLFCMSTTIFLRRKLWICTDMALRITYAILFIRWYFKASASFSLWRALPGGHVTMVLMLSACTTWVSNQALIDRELSAVTAAKHIGVGVACVACLLGTIYTYERPFLMELRNLRGKRNQQSDKEE
eukprot:SM000030S11442  [mRNA]  locus=s30:728715:732851:+ [translate_table: standard]